MSFATPLRRSVDLFADVVVAAPAGRLTLTGTGHSLEISASSLHVHRDLAVFLRRRSRSERRRLFTRLGRVLRAGGLELSFLINDREIARMGGSGTSWIARALALPGARIRIGQLLAALLRSPVETRYEG